MAPLDPRPSPVPDLAGQIDIQLQGRGRAPGAVIRSRRPLSAARVFAGKPLDIVGAQLPLVFSVCGTAQAMACALASEAALGRSPAPSAARARGLLLRAETVKEHLWRLLLDWPRALARLDPGRAAASLIAGAAEREAALAGALRAFLRLRGALAAGADPFRPGAGQLDPARDVLEDAAATLVSTAAEQVLGRTPCEWLAGLRTTADLARWAAQADTQAAALVRVLMQAGLADLGRCGVGRLPAECGGDLLARLARALAADDADAFVAEPLLDGLPAETTPFARELPRGGLVADVAAVHGNGLLARLAALLAELARDCAALAAAPAGDHWRSPALASDLAALAPPSGALSAVGVGAVPAARGLLVHRVALRAGDTTESTRVLGYRILAPTEWNFHPAGVVATGLADIAGSAGLSADERTARAHLLITAVDPCVAYRLAVS